jgi:pyruvate, orthophosphate dikinase
MPGMMESVLDLGLNDEIVEALAKKTGNPRFAYDWCVFFFDGGGGIFFPPRMHAHTHNNP